MIVFPFLFAINKTLRLAFCIVIVCLLYPVQTWAQQTVKSVSFYSLGINNGLSQGFVSGIMQDKKGFMWFATGDGLNRFDGYKFVVYHHDQDNPNTLISDDITCIFQDAKGRILIGTRNSGIDLFDPENNTFTHFQHTKGPGLHSNNIIQISGDKSGAIWIKTRDGIERMKIFAEHVPDGTKESSKIHYRAEFVRIKINQQAELQKEKSAPQGLFIDSRNRIFITTTDKVWQVLFTAKTNKYTLLERYKFISNDHTFVPELIEDKAGKRLLLNNRDIIQFADYEFNNPVKIYNYNTYQICTVIDKEQNLWLSHDKKITLLNLKTGRIQNLTSNIPGQDLAVSSLKYFYCDKTGVVWIASGGYGVLKYDPEAELFQHILPGKAIYQLVIDKKNEIYTNTFNTIKLNKNQDAEIFNYLDFQALKKEYPKINVSSFAKDSGNYIYLGVKGNLLKYNLKTRHSIKIPLPYKNINDIPFPIYCDDKNNIWMGYKGFLINFEPSTGKFSSFEFPARKALYDYDFLQQIYQDGKILWLGTTDGLFSFDMMKGKMIGNYSHNSKNITSLSNNYILSLRNDSHDPAKYLWIGTKGGGLNRLDKQTKNFSRFNTKNGLPNNVIYGILTDRQGKLWISTNKGISHFDPAKNSFQNFIVDDGLQSNEFNRYAFAQTTDGLLFFGGMNGINYFDPQTIKPLDPPSVVFTEFRLFNKQVIPSDTSSVLKVDLNSAKEIRLKYNQNVLTFQFAAMDYRKPGNIRYRYMMDGFDRGYIYAGTAREATYSNLDPGEYHFKVQANYGTTGWGNKYASLQLIIIPPWYKTWWFYILSVISIGALLYGLHLFRLSQIRRENDLRNRIARDLHDEVGSSLSTIAIYSKIVQEQNSTPSFDREPLLHKITDNATEIMESMSDIVWNIYHEYDAFESIVNRMREHAYQLFEAKGYILHFDFDEGLLKRKMSMAKRRNFYLIYKEALNNAAKYADGKNIWISLTTQNNTIILVVADDGKGFDSGSKSGGNGLSNMAHRAKIIHGELKVISAPNRGTRIELKL